VQCGIGWWPRSDLHPIITSLLTALGTMGDAQVQQRLIHDLRYGWGRGQDAMVFRIVVTIADRPSPGMRWDGCRATVTRAWRYQPLHVVVSLVDRPGTRFLLR
jgi:hypothetical protein